MSDIILENVSVLYKNSKKHSDVIALDNISTSFETGSFNVICGYSGCGKTTLLKTIAGLIDYDGNITFNNVDARSISVGRRNIAYVSQNYALYPHMTVFDNIAEPLKNIGCKREEIIERVTNVADFFDLSFCLSRKPKVLSGGQMQRVCLARAMVKKPILYLFDEPLSNIDQQHRYEAKTMIRKTVKEYSSTAIYVTHDFNEAMSIADYIYIMHEGKIILSGKPLDVYNSNNEIVNSLKSEVSLGELLQPK